MRHGTNRTAASQWNENFAQSAQEILTYNPAGNVSHMAREHSTYDLTYDPADQLTQSVFQGLQGVPSYNKTFGYDPLGNAISDSHGNTLSEFVSNFLVRNGQSSFTADPDGLGQVAQEVTGDQAKNYTYRADGKPSSFQSGNRTVNSFYDALGRLVAQQVNDNGNLFTNSFLYLGMSNQILQAKAGDGTITTYIDGQGPNEHLGEVKNGVGKGYITDHTGSVLNSLAAGSSRSYGLLGEIYGNVPVSSSMSPVMYAWQGLRYDPLTGQYDNLARRYNQNTGTFMSQDPIGIDGGINLYGSRKNNPLLFTDPSGLAVGDWWDFPANLDRARQIAGEELARRPRSHNDMGDAMRHSEWMRRTTQETNSCTAWIAGTGHEIEGLLRGQDLDEMLMDLHNNAVGRDAGSAGNPVDPNRLWTLPNNGSSYNPYSGVR